MTLTHPFMDEHGATGLALDAYAKNVRFGGGGAPDNASSLARTASRLRQLQGLRSNSSRSSARSHSCAASRAVLACHTSRTS